MLHRVPRRLVAVALLAGVVGAASGCASTVSMTPAAGSNDPVCAEVSVLLPEAVADRSRRWTDAQATGAWGDPAAVLLTCGLPALSPTTLDCESVDGIDWVIDTTDAPRYRYTTFGRSPAVEVYVDSEQVAAAQALSDLATAVSALPVNGLSCTERAAG